MNTASSPSAFDTATQPRRSNKTTIPDSKRETDLLFQLCAVEVVEGVIRQTCVSEATTMIVIGIILSFISLGFLWWAARICSAPHFLERHICAFMCSTT